MTQPRRAISFLATADADAATQFYGRVLGLKLLDASPFALVFDDGDTMLRVQIVERVVPVPYTVHGWQVSDIASEITELGARGAVFEHFGNMGQDALGIWTSPDGHKIAWFKDPGGNMLSLTEFSGADPLVTAPST